MSDDQVSGNLFVRPKDWSQRKGRGQDAAALAYRMQHEDLKHWYVRNSAGDMVPFSAFTSASWGSDPAKLERYSGMSSFEVVGSPAAGVSFGTAMAEVEKIAATLPTGITCERAGQSFQERLSGSQAPALYAVSNNVCFQIGLLTTVDPSAKNAILIVEFAQKLDDKGAWT